SFVALIAAMLYTGAMIVAALPSIMIEKRLASSVLPIVLALTMSGCMSSDPDPVHRPPIREEEYDSILVILLDTSGSFTENLDTFGFPFCGKALDNFYQDRIGEGNDL